ncbi:hypothetical protein KKD81_02470 [Patescibacteria group bacterium]|nr:hypothetical protein [Patescibacteria group bacterium]MBU2220781.1 hypothetical protein [Patescibacteria group bacterium]
MGYIPAIDHTSSYEDFLRLMREARTKTGESINLETYDAESPESLLELYTSTQNRDVIIQLHPQMQHVMRFCQNLTALVENTRLRTTWFEVSRARPSGKTVRAKRPFTFRETRKKGELPKDTLFRMFREEFPEFTPLESEIKFDYGPETIHPPYDSSAYLHVITHATTVEVNIVSDRFDIGRERTFRDYGGREPSDNNWVDITLRAF